MAFFKRDDIFEDLMVEVMVEDCFFRERDGSLERLLQFRGEAEVKRRS